MLAKTLQCPKPLIGMVHLPPLPGTVRYDGRSLDQMFTEAVADARVLKEAGFNAVIVQNTHDIPTATEVGHDTTAFLTAAVCALKSAVDVPFGINIHKSGAASALAVAAATAAAFVRIKVYTGAVLGPEGVIEGCAPIALRERMRLGITHCQILADVFDITSVPLRPQDIGEAAHWAIKFGGADGLVITGHTFPDTLERIARVREVHPEAQIFAGGGVSHKNVVEALAVTDGIIVGSALEERPFTGPVSLSKAREFVRIARG